MAPVSLLPGRARFECRRLLGREELCGRLQAELESLTGILEVAANPRTGRVLVRYEEPVLSRLQVETCLGRALDVVEAMGGSAPVANLPKPGPRRTIPFSAKDLVADMALHALLPSPLDLLIPAAATALRR